MPKLSFKLRGKSLLACVILKLLLLFYPSVQLSAQDIRKATDQYDTLKNRANTILTDSIKRILPPVNNVKSAFNFLNSSEVRLDMIIESENRYQPVTGFNLNNAIAKNNKFISSINLRGNLIVAGIPININYATNKNLGNTYSPINDGLFKFDYNPLQLNKLLGSDLDAYYALRKNAFSGLSLSSYTNNLIVEKIQTTNHGIGINGQLMSYLQDENNLASLYKLTDVALRQKLTEVAVGDSILQIEQHVKSNVKSSAAIHLKSKDSLLNDSVRSGIVKSQHSVDSINQMLSTVRGSASEVSNQVDTALAVIASLRNSLIKQGYDVDKLFQMQRLLKSSRGDLANSEIVQNYIKTKPLNTLQSFFSNVEALKIGAFGKQVPGGIQSPDLFLTGTHITYAVSSVPITVGYGNLNDVRSLKDAGYQSSVYNTPRTLTYLSANVFRNSANDVKISVVSAFSKNARNNNDYFIPVISENNVAVTLSKQFKSSKAGNFILDVSKSTTLYSNNYQIGSEAILARKEGVVENTAENLFTSLSFGFNHMFDLKSIGLSDAFYFNYAGLGYQNPANNGSGGARVKLGGNLRKALFSNKLIFTMRTDIKNMPISYTSDDKWKTLQLQLDTRYQLNKKTTINLKYTTSSTDKKVNGIETPVYNLKKLQVDGNLRYKLGKNYAVNHLTMGYQSYGNSNASAGVGNMFTLNYTQSLIINKNVLSFILFYNKELSPQKLIGNMTNAEMSYHYPLFHIVNLTSGITYLNNGSIAKQAGIRQGIQLFTKSNFDIDTYVDLRKNIITPQYTDMYASCRAEIMLRYHITNK